jgi:hypothetical protein
LPSQNPAARTKAWRAFKALGAAVLRDGVYVLPASKIHEESLRRVGQDIEMAGGTAELLLMKARDSEQETRFQKLFDRASEFGEVITQAQSLSRERSLDLPHVERQLRGLQKQFEQIVAIDFFPGEAQAQASRALAACEKKWAQKLSPGEPRSSEAPIPRLNIQNYQGRTWVSRARPWIDRLASAWLIQRHIDQAASFIWLKDLSTVPAGALGFDFDGAAFTHVGGRVTFETLLESFGLDEDPALRQLAAIVHYLDVGGVPAPEAPGLAAVLTGTRVQAGNDDNTLFQSALTILDSLYTGLKEPL